MKLILENWRKYLKEEQGTLITKLRVFDFDDTLIHTFDDTLTYTAAKTIVPKVIVRDKKRKKIRTLDSQEELEDYKKTEGEELDFSEFLNVNKKAPPIKKIIKIFRNLVEHPGKDRKVMIITARMSEAVPEIKDYLENLKPPIDLTDVEVVGTGGDSKAPYVQRELDGLPNVNSFIMFDDSEKNLVEVRAMLEENFPDIEVKLRRPKIEDGEVRVPIFRD